MVSFSFPDRVRFLVANVSVGGCCTAGQKSSNLKKMKKSNRMVDFIFCPPHSSSTVNSGVLVVTGIASVGAAVLASGSLSAAAAVAACVPIIVPMTNSLIDAGVPIGDAAKRSMSHLTTVTSLQLSFGLIEFLTGDIVNGFIHMLMAGVGFYVVQLDGIVLLPSYSVASTVFASVSVLNLLEMLLYKGTVGGDLAMSENFLKLATICHPFLYFASAYYAWKLIEQLRAGLLAPTAPTNGLIGTGSPSVVFEPSRVIIREPFVGRGFRLNDAPPQVPLDNEIDTQSANYLS